MSNSSELKIKLKNFVEYDLNNYYSDTRMDSDKGEKICKLLEETVDYIEKLEEKIKLLGEKIDQL